VTEEKPEEKTIADPIATNIVRLAEFLDPHLPAESASDTFRRSDRWSVRRAWAFLILASLLGWGVLFAVLHYASLSMSGR
jgi:hypothetical protein